MKQSQNEDLTHKVTAEWQRQSKRHRILLRRLHSVNRWCGRRSSVSVPQKRACAQAAPSTRCQPPRGRGCGRAPNTARQTLTRNVLKGGKMTESGHNRSPLGPHTWRRPPLPSLSSEWICHSSACSLSSTVTFHQWPDAWIYPSWPNSAQATVSFIKKTFILI